MNRLSSIKRGGAALLFLLVLLPLTAQVDGMIGSGEYPNRRDLKEGTLYWKVVEEQMFIAYDAPTEGWVSLGFGGLRMDGTLMILGYVDGGEQAYTVDRGQGHRHSPISESIDLDVAVKESSDKTVLEIRIPLSAFPANSSGGSDHIIAFGRRDNFTSLHRYRDAQSLPH